MRLVDRIGPLATWLGDELILLYVYAVLETLTLLSPHPHPTNPLQQT